MNSQSNPEVVNALTNQSIAFASCGALVVQIWEFANSFFDEIEYISRSRFTFIKSLYIWSRYIPLITQIVNLALTHRMYLTQRAKLCVGTFAYKAIAGHLSLTCVELILLMRVYALYNRSRRIKIFLCTAFVASFSLEIWGISQVIKTVIRGDSCVPETAPSQALIAFGASATFLQGLILCMTAFKYVVGHHYGWARTPLTSLILREGIIVCFLIFGLVMTNLIFTRSRTVQLTISHAAFSWMISLLSVTGCRLILDMRKLSRRLEAGNPDEISEVIEFTSNLDMAMTSQVTSELTSLS